MRAVGSMGRKFKSEMKDSLIDLWALNRLLISHLANSLGHHGLNCGCGGSVFTSNYRGFMKGAQHGAQLSTYFTKAMFMLEIVFLKLLLRAWLCRAVGFAGPEL
jgi:hypothetical protein